MVRVDFGVGGVGQLEAVGEDEVGCQDGFVVSDEITGARVHFPEMGRAKRWPD